MGRLFWKLFLSYWAALILFAAGTLIAASSYIEHTRAGHDKLDPQQRFQSHLRDARAAAARGIDNLKHWASRIDGDELVPLLLLDRDGHDLLGRETPERSLIRLQRLRMREQLNATDSREIRLADGREYWLVPDFEGATLRRFISRPRVMAVPLVLAALVGGLVCLLLARYLTSPVARLRRATQAYASGDFSQRASPALGGRRDEIVDLAHAMDDMAERLDLMLKSQSALLRDVSHELRSPLARVQAALGLARQRGGAEGELDRIERETERLNELIGAILSFSRLESGVRTPARELIDLDQLLAEVVSNANLESKQRQVRVQSVDVAQAPYLGDPLLLHSALDNILRNAVHHAPENSAIEVSLTTDTEQGAKGGYIIRIRDHGPGVPEDMLDHIFQPFVRATAPQAGQAGGIGLGLAIARRAVEAHNGTVRAENHPDGGLLVTVCLPRSE
ncbi:MAG TPA: ATP-binding protein [Thiobacillaceae bacterium]|nr:ATP-binding protein [Thiobacillaceae bacterium]